MRNKKLLVALLSVILGVVVVCNMKKRRKE